MGSHRRPRVQPEALLEVDMRPRLIFAHSCETGSSNKEGGNSPRGRHLATSRARAGAPGRVDLAQNAGTVWA